MSKFGKVLLVLLLVLSAVFTGAQMVLYGRRQNYARLYLDMKKAHQDLESTLKRDKSEWESTKQDLQSKLQGRDLQVKQLESQVENARGDIKRVETQRSQLEVANKELRDSVDKQTKINEASATQIKQLDERRQELEKTTREQMAEIDQLKKSGHEKDVRIAGLQENIAKLEKTKTELAEAVKALERQQSRYVAMGVALPQEDVPVMDARVLKVDSELRVVVLSVGSDDGVKVANDFVVYRGDAYVATVRVSFVAENTCVAQPVITGPGQTIQVGDAATTRIQ
jgi:myosin heavy subunit